MKTQYSLVSGLVRAFGAVLLASVSCAVLSGASRPAHAFARKAQKGDIVKAASGPTQYKWEYSLDILRAFPDQYTKRILYPSQYNDYVEVSDDEFNKELKGKVTRAYDSELKKLIGVPQGDPIMVKGDSGAVYLVFRGYKQHILDPKSLDALAGHAVNPRKVIHQMSDEDTALIPDGRVDPLTERVDTYYKKICDRPNGSVIKGGPPTQYGVDGNGALRAIPDPATLERLFPGVGYEQVPDECITFFRKRGETYPRAR